MQYESNYLEHHGVVGMRWGVRRYRNSSGALTSTGRKLMSKLASGETSIAEEKAKHASAYRQYGSKRKKLVFFSTLLGGPLVGILSAAITQSTFNKIRENINTLNDLEKYADMYDM